MLRQINATNMALNNQDRAYTAGGCRQRWRRIQRDDERAGGLKSEI
jgi:hypothetical protein